MSCELVTGYSGIGPDGEPNRHVSSSDDGFRQAGTVGLGCYVLGTGNRLAASMEDANTLVVTDGDAMINGRHVRMSGSTSFTIPTGVQGQKVSNVAVLRYEVGDDSVETVTPLVLTGDPSAGDPVDPAHREGSVLDGDSVVDFPIYRVVTDGITPGNPEPLFDVLMPMSELRDEIDGLRDSVSREPKIFVGSKSGQFGASGHSFQMIGKIEFMRIAGREFDPNRDFVGFMNAVWSGSPVLVTCIYNDADGYLYAITDKDVSASDWYRFNYVIALASD